MSYTVLCSNACIAHCLVCINFINYQHFTKKYIQILGNKKIDFEEFLKFAKKTHRDPEEIKCSLTEAFKTLDTNGDGFITREELKSVMTKMGERLSEEEAEEMIRKADQNEDGKINYEGMI